MLNASYRLVNTLECLASLRLKMHHEQAKPNKSHVSPRHVQQPEGERGGDQHGGKVAFLEEANLRKTDFLKLLASSIS